MKDSFVNVLLFGVIFALVAAFAVGGYALYNVLVPGGRGLIFASPFSTALFPALLVALVFAQYRSIHHPGRFTFTWIAIAGVFFFLLAASVPLIQQAPPFRAPDASPLAPGRFLNLEDQSVLFQAPGASSKGQFAEGVVEIPSDGGPMVILDRVPFDPLNQRFLLPGDRGGARAVVESGPERAYFGYPTFYQSLQLDLFAIYSALRASAETSLVVYGLQVGGAVLLFMGLYFFFSFKTWPLVQIILVFFIMRLQVSFLAYAYQGLPLVVGNWVSGPGLPFWQSTVPIALVLLTGLTLLFMTMLTKPHRTEALA